MESFEKFIVESSDQTYNNGIPQSPIHNDFTPVPKRPVDPRRQANDNPDLSKTVQDTDLLSKDKKLARLLGTFPKKPNGTFDLSRATGPELAALEDYFWRNNKPKQVEMIRKMINKKFNIG